MIVESGNPHDVLDLLQESVDFIRSLYPEEAGHDYNLDEILAGRFMIAIHDGLVIGCGAYVWHGADEVELKHMYVGPMSRGLGVGRGLLQALEDRARLDGVKRIILETSQKQVEAIGLYKRFGYLPCDPYNEGHDEDIFMAKDLASPSDD